MIVGEFGVNTKFQRFDIYLGFVALCGLLLFVFLYNGLFPEAGIHLEIDKKEIVAQSKEIVEGFGYSLEGYRSQCDFKHNGEQLQYLERTFGPNRTNHLLSDSLSIYFWEIDWKEGRISNITVSNDAVESETESEFGWFQIMLDMNGHPMAFHFFPNKNHGPDSTIVVSSEEAHVLARNVLANIVAGDVSDWQPQEDVQDSNPTKGQYAFKWKNKQFVAGLTENIRVFVAQGQVVSFERTYEIPETFNASADNTEIFEIVSFIVVYLLFIVLGSIFFVKRLRADLLDLKSGMIPGILVFAGFCLTFFLPHTESRMWEMVLGFVIAAPFMTGGMWAIFVLGESYTREVWPEKLHSIDLLRRNRLFPQLGVALIRGMLLSGLVLGLMALIEHVVMHGLNAYFTFGESRIQYWGSPVPSLYAFGIGLIDSLYIIVTYCLFFSSFIRRKTKSVFGLLAIILFFWAFVSFPLPKLLPFQYRMIGNAIIGLLLILFYLKFDFLTVTIGMMLVPALFYGVASFHVNSLFYVVHGSILLSLFAITGVVAVIALRKKDDLNSEVLFIPDYLQRIYERERIHRELEIARNVQLNFLPHKKPSLDAMEVASICLPAREVGGDYYDFIDLGPRKLGIAIGDVSGKGIPAAFYMTLTKGFLRSQARLGASPRQVLIHMNELFYESADRDVFISMIYAIFDFDAGTLTVSRAGHNPMILKRQGELYAQDIAPPGLALGLERGELFSKTIQEHTLGISPGDCYLFYTDGFNEAQNRFKEEFGEDRLRKIIEQSDAYSAEDLLAKLQTEVVQFMGNAMQHDDMTAVLVKIQDQ